MPFPVHSISCYMTGTKREVLNTMDCLEGNNQQQRKRPQKKKNCEDSLGPASKRKKKMQSGNLDSNNLTHFESLLAIQAACKVAVAVHTTIQAPLL